MLKANVLAGGPDHRVLVEVFDRSWDHMNIPRLTQSPASVLNTAQVVTLYSIVQVGGTSEDDGAAKEKR